MGEGFYSFGGRKYKREDLEIRNPRGHTLQCSHLCAITFTRLYSSTLRCILSCGCRADANEAAVVLLPLNITIFTLDFSGSGLFAGEYVSLGWHESFLATTMEPFEKQFMKKVMLKHEETFKHQVHELHRLYRTQKRLMKDIDKSRETNQHNQEMSIPVNGSSLFYRTTEKDSNKDGEVEIEDESEIQLTLGPTSSYWRMKEETPRSSNYYGPSFTSSSSSVGSKRTSWGLGSTRDNSFHDEEKLSQVKQQQQQPPNWLLQSLSLKMN